MEVVHDILAAMGVVWTAVWLYETLKTFFPKPKIDKDVELIRDAIVERIETSNRQAILVLTARQILKDASANLSH